MPVRCRGEGSSLLRGHPPWFLGVVSNGFFLLASCIFTATVPYCPVGGAGFPLSLERPSLRYRGIEKSLLRNRADKP